MSSQNVDCVGWRQDGNVAVVVIDHPPVNALNHAVRAGLIDALTQAQRDSAIAAIVLTGAGRMFTGGADISEFDKAPVAPRIADVIALIDAMQKPVIAALH